MFQFYEIADADIISTADIMSGTPHHIPGAAGIECALWPHLYWDRNLCETVNRLNHEERRGRKRKAAAMSTDSSNEDDEEASEEPSAGEAEEAARPALDNKLGRIKRGFLRKVLSPVMGYGTDYELLHFVYDLSMWSTVGTKKNIARRHDVPLRLVLKDCPWTPQYWRIRHAAVIDMQRQCGNAALFRTRAPYERTFPYHECVMHEQRLAGRARLQLAGAETLYIAHVLIELDKAFISGGRCSRDRPDRNWKNQHLLGPSPEYQQEAGQTPQTVVNRVTRLEFQDGKRKLGKQAYHGRGATHSHSLDFLRRMARIGLEKKLSAHLPDKKKDPLLHGLVLDGQCDRTNSGIPIREEPSAWDDESQKVQLQHTEEDKDLKIRPYFPTTMQVTKCHEDVQQADGNGAVLHYVATYSMKFSDSMDQNWLNDQASDYSVARRILFSYHPLEPEMWLTLATERFPQMDYQGTLVDIHVPVPSCEQKPKRLQNYEESAWRRDDMSLLEFLRKSNDSGKIMRYIKEQYMQHCKHEILQEYIAQGQEQKAAYKMTENLLKAYRLQLKDADGSEANELEDFVNSRLGIELPGLNAFANVYQTKGEKLVAAGTYSMFNDRYYGQWTVLHVPFRNIADLEAQFAEQLIKAGLIPCKSCLPHDVESFVKLICPHLLLSTIRAGTGALPQFCACPAPRPGDVEQRRGHQRANGAGSTQQNNGRHHLEQSARTTGSGAILPLRRVCLGGRS